MLGQQHQSDKSWKKASRHARKAIKHVGSKNMLGKANKAFH